MTDQSSTPNWPQPIPSLRGPWLGQPAPSQMTEFCPALFRETQRVAGVTFDPSGEEAFFTWNIQETAHLMHTVLESGLWSTPKMAPFNSSQVDNDICMSPDGQRLCWRSWRSVEGTEEQADTVALWAADRTPVGWSDPFPVECGGERQAGVYPGIGLSGTLYFSVKTADGEHIVARAKRSGQQYEARETILRGMSPGGDLCVAPDESFLVVTAFDNMELRGNASLYISFQTPEGAWTQPRKLDPPIDSAQMEYCPTISSDGKWLFFCRIDREDRSVPARAYWVPSEAIEQLRPAETRKEQA